jgi:hypothetical protein
VLITGCALNDSVSLGRYQESDVAGGPVMGLMPSTGQAVGAAGALGISTRDPAVQDAGPEPSRGQQPGAPAEPADSRPMTNACAGTRYVADLSFVCPAPSMRQAPWPTQPLPPEMSSVMRFALVPSATVPGTAEIVDSDFTFNVLDRSVSGHLTGQLDCASGTFNASFADGVASGMRSPEIPAVGELSGTLDPISGRLSGTWWHGPADFVACTGSWIAQAPR